MHHAAVPCRNGAVAALVDACALYGQVRALLALNAHSAAAVKSTGAHRGAAAAVQIQYASGAGAGLFRVARAQVLYGQAPAVAEREHIGVARQSADRGFVRAGAPDRQVIHVVDLQLISVVDIHPAAVGIDLSGVFGRGQCENVFAEFDHGARRDCRKQLIQSGYAQDVFFRGDRLRCRV